MKKKYYDWCCRMEMGLSNEESELNDTGNCKNELKRSGDVSFT